MSFRFFFKMFKNIFNCNQYSYSNLDFYTSKTIILYNIYIYLYTFFFFNLYNIICLFSLIYPIILISKAFYLL